MKEIRIGIVGLGMIAQYHIKNIISQQAIYGSQNGTVRFVIAVDVDGELAQRTCDR